MAPRGSKTTAEPTPKAATQQPPQSVPEVPPPEEPFPQNTTRSETKSDNRDIPQKESQETQSPRSSWYSRTWPRKAAAVTKVAEESISAAGNAASSLAKRTSDSKIKSPPKPPKTPSIHLTRSGGSIRSLPANATTTKLHATSDPSLPKVQSTSSADKSPNNVNHATDNHACAADTQDVTSKTGTASIKSKDQGTKHDTSPAKTPPSDSTNSNWLGWFAKSGPKEKSDTSTMSSVKQEDKSEQKLEAKEESGVVNADMQPPSAPISVSKELTESMSASESQPQQPSSHKRSWLQMWNSSSGESSSAIPIKGAASAGTKPLANSVDDGNSQSGSKASSIIASPPPDLPGDGSKSAGWIFWSSDRKGGGNGTNDGPRIGELAVSDTPSQKRPKRASIDVDGGKEKAVEAVKEPPKAAPAKKAKAQILQEADSRPQTPINVSKEEQSTGGETPPPVKSSKGAELHQASKQLAKTVPNLLLPSFKDTFSLQENPSIWQQLARMLNYSKTPEPRHVYQLRDPPRITNAIAIGVHGYFPAPLIRSVLGQPTGTSIKFTEMASKAIRKWTNAHGYDCEVKTAALEGEGKIAERVDILWKLLLNWIEEIRKADFIFVACHSQGVPVAIQLIAKLITFGCVNTARIGICAMAGVNLGPFSDYKSRWITGSAGELFEFGHPESKISRDYLAALETALKFGVMISYIGSIDDQLVSLESSTFSPVSHPHIYRAVFVDGRVHASNFLTHLVGFALKLRNLGVADHGLIRELSWPLAGSLYTGDGHSRVYDDEAVYDLAIEFALETTSVNNTPLSQRPAQSGSSNPYILPFAMRGLLEEEYVKTELYNEATDLLKQFDEWKPSSKVLKDVKFRLEGVRSKL